LSGLNIDNLKTFIGRGSHKESHHEAIAIAAPNEGPRLLFGSADPGTFLRSVAKPFQALAMLRAGIAESFSLSPEELAVICSSHAGEPIHRDLVRALLSRGGLSESHLDCGVHAPFSRSERVRIIASGELPDVTCSNCSGKHTGMLLACVARGYPVEGYLDPSHPLQRSIRAMVELFTGEVLEPASFGVDGCGAPTFFMPLASIARAFHRLHDDQFLKRCGLEERVERMHDELGDNPLHFEVTIDERGAYALYHELEAGKRVTLSTLKRSRADYTQKLQLIFLLAMRGDETILLPDEEMEVERGMKLLITATEDAKRDFEYIVNNYYELYYVMTGKEKSYGIWEWLQNRKERES